MHQTDKVRKQQVKLLKEFPWLWAIRNNWELGFHNIQVLRTLNKIRMFNIIKHEALHNLWQIMKQKPSEGFEVWFCQQSDKSISITQLPFNLEIESNMLHIDSLRNGSDNIIAIVVGDPVTPQRYRFDIYLPPKKIGSFNRIIGTWLNNIPEDEQVTT